MSHSVAPSNDSVRTVVVGILILSGAAFSFLVWILFFRERSEPLNPESLSFLPAVNASLNGLCATCILCGFAAIKTGHRRVHMGFMITAVTLSAVFLVSYIVYHTIHGDTKFVTEGVIRYVYFGVLISHIVCTAFTLPLIFSAVYFAATKRFELHKKVTRFTFPLWLYVSLTGVTIYFLLEANS
jgi:putative membrane protein